MKVTARDRILNAGCHAIRWSPMGKRSLFKALRFAMGNPERFVMSTDGFGFVVDCEDQDVAMRVALNRAYEPAVGALFLHHMRPGATVVDVGANKGYYVLVAARRVGPSGHVIAIEADPRNVADLNDTVSLNPNQPISVVAKAAAESNGSAEFDVSGWSEKNSAWGQIVRGNGAPQGKSTRVTVATCSLDDEFDSMGINHVDVMKMDIQGGEVVAIDGMSRLTQERRIGTILLELHDTQLSGEECHSILDKLFAAGYSGRCFDQNEFSHEESLAAINGRKTLTLDNKGMDARDYSFTRRAERPGYRKPLQFLLST